MEQEKKEKSYTALMAEEYRIKQYVWQHLGAHAKQVTTAMGRMPTFVAPFGSWNYGLQHEGNDMDSYVYLTPTYEDIIFNAPLKKEFKFDNLNGTTDVITVKSLQNLFTGVAACSPTALELIYSPFSISPNREIEIYYILLRCLADDVVQEMPFRVLMNLIKMGQNNLKRANGVQLEYNPERKKKQILTAFRAVEMIEAYMGGKNYEQMLIASTPERSQYKMAKHFMEVEEENISLAWNIAYNRLEHLDRNIHELYGGTPQQTEQELEAKGKALWKQYVTEKIVIPAIKKEENNLT